MIVKTDPDTGEEYEEFDARDTRWWQFRNFCAYWYFCGWSVQLGFHLDITSPNVEIHLPCGYIRVGWGRQQSVRELLSFRAFGYEDGRWQFPIGQRQRLPRREAA